VALLRPPQANPGQGGQQGEWGPRACNQPFPSQVTKADDDDGLHADAVVDFIASSQHALEPAAALDILQSLLVPAEVVLTVRSAHQAFVDTVPCQPC